MSLVYPFQMSLSLAYGFEEFVAGAELDDPSEAAGGHRSRLRQGQILAL